MLATSQRLVFCFLATFSMSVSRADVLWTENAENGSLYVNDQTSSSYPLIQSEIAGQGTYAFHLANPNFQSNWFELEQSLTIQADTKLFMLSRLGWATSAQVAKVQISTDGGSTWPTDLYTQAGTGNSGEGSFGLKQIDLSSYAEQTARFRFLYDFQGGSAFTQTSVGVGWYVDDIQIADQLQKIPYSIGNPSVDAQQYLEYINRARADAIVEANRLANETDSDVTSSYNFFGVTGTNIVNQFQWSVNNGVIDQVAQPLSFNAALNQAAQLHTLDMFNQEFQGHDSSSSPPDPFVANGNLGNRLDAVNYNYVGAGENVFSFADSVRQGYAGFNVDWGNTSDPTHPNYNPAFAGQGMQNPAGHRNSIHNGDFKEIGIGVINDTNGSVGPQLVTQDFGNPGDAAFVTGVVFEDLNDNNFYDPGEGRSGVRVDVDGSAFYAITSDSGGYSVPVGDDGTYDVLFSSQDYANFATTATITGGWNTKIDYLVSSVTYASDFDGNGQVDGADLTEWQETFGSSIDGSDFLTWQREFGSGTPAASLAVPEPSTALLLLLGGLLAGFRRG